MKIALVTTRSNLFIEAFLRSYAQNGGPKIGTIIFMQDRSLQTENFFDRLLFAFRIFGFNALAIVALYKRCRPLLCGRYRRAGLNTSLAKTIEDLGAEVMECQTAREVGESIEGMDLLVSLGAPIVFKQSLLEIPRRGSLNVHNGDVPYYRGHFSTFWEIANQEKETVSSIHEMAAKVDSGHVYAKHYLNWREFSNLLDLVLEKKIRGGGMLAELVKAFDRKEGSTSDELSPLPTDPERASRYYGFPTLKDADRFSFDHHGPAT